MKTTKILLLMLALMGMGGQVAAQLQVGTTYRIVPVTAPGKSLFVSNSSKAVNTAVQVWTETDVPAQQWTLVQATTASLGLQNVYTGMYLSQTANTIGGTARQVSNVTNGRWLMEPVDEEAGIYKIKPSTGSTYLTLSSTEDGALPTLARAEDSATQQWRFVPVNAKDAFNTTIREEMMDRFIDGFVTTRYGNRTFGNGGWGNAEMLEVGLDAYESTGLKKYLDLCRSDYQNFVRGVGSRWDGGAVSGSGYDWFGYDFNDDVMWEIIAVARLAWMTGEAEYLTAAKNNFDYIYQRAYMPRWGMMRWAERSGDVNGTNSCIMGPAEVAACYLGMAGAGEEYFEKARDLYAKQRQYLANMTTGQVYDSFVWDPNTGGVAHDEKGNERFNRWASTYNQGTMLGAAVLLYNHYGDEQYRRDADAIVRYTRTSMCDAYGIIKVCQVIKGDLCGFKGILMRYLRRYVLDLSHPELKLWTINNAFHAYNNRDNKGLTHSAWLTKSLSDSTYNSFSCSTAASAAVNSVLTEVNKDAFTLLTPPNVDYHGGTFVVNVADTPVLTVKDGVWAVFDNVNFDTQTAQSIALSIGRFPSTGTATIKVYLDRLDSEPIATITATRQQASSTVIANIIPTTGQHHVYLHFGYSNPTWSNAYQLAGIQFSTQTAEELIDGISMPTQSTSEETQSHSSILYDLNGRAVSNQTESKGTPTKKGLYIKDGKKIFFK